MNELAIKEENAVATNVDTKKLIKVGVSENKLKAYRYAFKIPDAWLSVEENGFRIDTNGSGAWFE